MITDKLRVRRGIVVAHKNGNVYIVTRVVGERSNERDCVWVEYMGANGDEWKRPLEEFLTSMTLVYDGNNKVDAPYWTK